MTITKDAYPANITAYIEGVFMIVTLHLFKHVPIYLMATFTMNHNESMSRMYQGNYRLEKEIGLKYLVSVRMP
jgi:hypothetical protein